MLKAVVVVVVGHLHQTLPSSRAGLKLASARALPCVNGKVYNTNFVCRPRSARTQNRLYKDRPRGSQNAGAVPLRIRRNRQKTAQLCPLLRANLLFERLFVAAVQGHACLHIVCLRFNDAEPTRTKKHSPENLPPKNDTPNDT